MMKYLVFVLMLIYLNPLHGQSKHRFYDPEFRRIHSRAKTIAQFLAEVTDDKIIREFAEFGFNDSNDIVVYKPLTDSILFIVAHDSLGAVKAAHAPRKHKDLDFEMTVERAVDNYNEFKTPLLTERYIMQNLSGRCSLTESKLSGNHYSSIYCDEIGYTFYFVEGYLSGYTKQ